MKQKYAARALAGHGGLDVDGRWHTAGRPVVYLASSEALAVLEVRVHLGPIVPRIPFTMLVVQCPEQIIETLPRRRWPREWDAIPFHVATQRLGDRWLASGAGLALRVPSVHSGSDFNVLLNPAHPGARRVKVVSRERHEFDIRLF